jgi:xanthine dehydrogenase accessory factor
MDSAEAEILRSAAEWLEQGHRVMLATVVACSGSSPRPRGSMVAVRADGRLAGSVSGGCVEDDLIERMHCSSLSTLPQVLDYGASAVHAGRPALPCGGSMQLVTEPAPDITPLRALLDAMEQRRLMARQLDLATGRVKLLPAGRDDQIRFDGSHLITVHGSRWQLLLIGAGQISRYTAQMALALDYRVAVCDPREEFTAGWSVPGTALVSGMPDDAVKAAQIDERSAVVALTHDPRLDDLALLEALNSDAFYVGALGSRTSNAKRRERLALCDIAPDQLERLHGPVGLPLGGRSAAEIALSILAEMTAVRYGVQLAPAGKIPALSS